MKVNPICYDTNTTELIDSNGIRIKDHQEQASLLVNTVTNIHQMYDTVHRYISEKKTSFSHNIVSMKLF